MSQPPLVPPIKCQGIKTKLVPMIAALATELPTGRWIEPFCGSGVVALNLRAERALLCDTNVHIIRFYEEIRLKALSSTMVRDYLQEQGEQLRNRGEDFYYEVRTRFNSSPNSMDFLFLNRSCFNGVMRFNRSGGFNVPFCRKPERFAPAYITKIVNQVRAVANRLADVDWEFKVADFKTTLSLAQTNDLVYADPPYAGRHTDYFNGWADQDEAYLASVLAKLPCRFILSTWHSNEFRANPQIDLLMRHDRYHLFTREHYYHVGADEELRHPMLEALVTNFPSQTESHQLRTTVRQTTLFDALPNAPRQPTTTRKVRSRAQKVVA